MLFRSIAKFAVPPTAPSSPKKSINYLLVLMLGFGLGFGIASLRKLLDNTVKSEDDLGDIPLLAAIGFDLNADRFIKKLLKAAPHKDQTLVVSSDREVRDTARRLLVRSLTAAEFVELLQQADESVVTEVRTNAALVKTSQDNNPELDRLLEEATERIPLKKDDLGSGKHAVPLKKMSKHERDLQQLKKKL